MEEQSLTCRPGDRIKVTASGITYTGHVLALTPEGMVLCLMDNSDRAQTIDPLECQIEVMAKPPVPKLRLY